MKILLTGSSGFVGSYFINKYNKKYNIETFSFLNDNLNGLNLSEISVVIHLSALVHKMDGASEEEYEKVNVIQTVELAKKAKESGVKHFIFMSTVKVYGEETQVAYRESTVCIPEDDYGKSKLKAEQELIKLKSEDFKVSIIRTPIVYGYGVKANIKNLIGLVKKIPVLPFGKIYNKRSMVYIGNLCHLVDVLINKKLSGVFLASDDTTLSTTNLIELIAKNLHKRVFLIKIPLFETMIKIFKPSFHKRLYQSLEVDNANTRKVLGFENIYTTDDGIKLMIHGENR